ncbi:hypothetical protein GUA98_15435 [Paenibacillus sp. P13VS]|nr:hypothetical protein [Paenibacillus sp. P13VS]MBM6385437.1 hypothetical protein [Paenibacillus sp.]MBY0217502.1 hypothetical protein [Paenibacillus illinoisensis]
MLLSSSLVTLCKQV